MSYEPARYRKKPVEIEAMQFDGTKESANQILARLGSNGADAKRAHSTKPDLGLIISTLEGDMHVSAGDFVIRGVQGEFYPCKPDIFAASYDPAPEPLELTPPEQAAVAKSPHMSTCHEPVCVDCAKELRQLRRYIVAIWPVIEKEAAKPLLAEIDRLRRIVKDVIDLTRDTDGDYLHPDSEIPVGEIQRVLYDREQADGIDSDGAPVAAASNPTPIPDGEE